VFAGGVALRYPERDLRAWPVSGQELEPHYAQVERLLAVARDPEREHAPVTRRIAAAGASLGLRPVALPLALQRAPRWEGAACVRCGTCDTFACAVGAKGDAASALLGPLLGQGLRLLSGMTAVRLLAEGGRIAGVRAVDDRGRLTTFRASHYVLAAGALATPQLLLASGLDALNPAGDAVGRYLMRHCNAVVMGGFPRRLPGARAFHKQVGFDDLYDRAGLLQQVGRPPVGLLRRHLPRPLRPLADELALHLTGLLAIAEDEPRAANRVLAPRTAPDAVGLPPCRVEHRYTQRDLGARAELVAAAGAVLRRAGAVYCHVVEVDTFSHALGTVRMGRDAATSPVAPDGRFRGVDNLWVTDASALPTPAAVNPSLTIAANARRVSGWIAGALREATRVVA
jgi:choline dehydrogenase-like flavoprotein